MGYHKGATKRMIMVYTKVYPMRFGYIALGTPPIQSLDIRKMPKLTDMQIRAWIKSGERFEGRADGNGLYLRYREADKIPTWRFRYKLPGRLALC